MLEKCYASACYWRYWRLYTWCEAKFNESPFITIALTQLLKNRLKYCVFFFDSFSTLVIDMHLIFVEIERIIDLIRCQIMWVVIFKKVKSVFMKNIYNRKIKMLFLWGKKDYISEKIVIVRVSILLLKVVFFQIVNCDKISKFSKPRSLVSSKEGAGPANNL